MSEYLNEDDTWAMAFAGPSAAKLSLSIQNTVRESTDVPKKENRKKSREEKEQSNINYEEHLTIWEAMMKKYENDRNEIETYRQNKKKDSPDYKLPESSMVEYMEKNVFSVLFPAFTNALMEGVFTGSLTNSRSTFNLIDAMSQNLWNSNPKYPARATKNLNIHEMPWAIKYLKENPRPRYPKSWIFTPETAAVIIQSFYRGYLVRKRDDVQEMREFWRNLQLDQDAIYTRDSTNERQSVSKTQTI